MSTSTISNRSTINSATRPGSLPAGSSAAHERSTAPGDILARLGGDEFAVILPIVRSRVDVEQMTLRLERCFEHTFAGEGCTGHGSASIGIAIYPADGTARDRLLQAADAAMYVHQTDQTGELISTGLYKL